MKINTIIQVFLVLFFLGIAVAEQINVRGNEDVTAENDVASSRKLKKEKKDKFVKRGRKKRTKAPKKKPNPNPDPETEPDPEPEPDKDEDDKKEEKKKSPKKKPKKTSAPTTAPTVAPQTVVTANDLSVTLSGITQCDSECQTNFAAAMEEHTNSYYQEHSLPVVSNSVTVHGTSGGRRLEESSSSISLEYSQTFNIAEGEIAGDFSAESIASEILEEPSDQDMFKDILQATDPDSFSNLEDISGVSNPTLAPTVADSSIPSDFPSLAPTTWSS